MKQFKGRVVVPGTCTAEALVSHGGFNTLASYQMAIMFGDKQVKCGDQNNPDLYKKPMLGKALCLPMTAPSWATCGPRRKCPLWTAWGRNSSTVSRPA